MRLTGLVNTLLAAAAVIGPVAIGLANATPAAGKPVIVITLPWADGDAMVTEVGGTPLLGGGPLGPVAIFDHQSLAAAGQKPGILLLLDGTKLSFLCGTA